MFWSFGHLIGCRRYQVEKLMDQSEESIQQSARPRCPPVSVRAAGRRREGRHDYLPTYLFHLLEAVSFLGFDGLNVRGMASCLIGSRAKSSNLRQFSWTLGEQGEFAERDDGPNGRCIASFFCPTDDKASAQPAWLCLPKARPLGRQGMLIAPNHPHKNKRPSRRKGLDAGLSNACVPVLGIDGSGRTEVGQIQQGEKTTPAPWNGGCLPDHHHHNHLKGVEPSSLHVVDARIAKYRTQGTFV
ncbi:hypothetical protein B0T17DRAFT_648297 [Bombardia bombarda]|uniref:Uncharacterized protein n=1 Tax=Bombardia bombarda TaxID=252184 RepID=A0AA39T265_9PEZI|nr:hypothetical protein B0T17DRAFT_648297 [Bombardia bombarda]